MTIDRLWATMNSTTRHPAADLVARDVPTSPGVYAWYRDGEPVYSGRAIGVDGLRRRVWKNHLGVGIDLSRSSFRRNVCEHLAVAPTTTTSLRPTVMTAADIEPVNRWIRGCEVTWIECSSPSEAKLLEKDLHREWMPPLTQR